MIKWLQYCTVSCSGVCIMEYMYRYMFSVFRRNSLNLHLGSVNKQENHVAFLSQFIHILNHYREQCLHKNISLTLSLHLFLSLPLTMACQTSMFKLISNTFIEMGGKYRERKILISLYDIILTFKGLNYM